MSAERIDWSQLWYPGPRRVFTADEMARAGGDGISRTAVMVALFNVACVALAMMQLTPAAATAPLLGLFVAGVIGGWVGLRSLWRSPTRRSLLLWCWALAAVYVAVMVGIAERYPKRDAVAMALVACASALLLMLMLTWWFACVFRAEQIAARLREQDERAQAVAAARQLATAQVQPHFLFNSLASLQHWVHAKDDRAAPLLDALMSFLRTTLPLFDQPQLRIGDELDAVRHYLGVMQLRLGERLRWSVDAQADAADALLPSGLLLTLVENAIEHGVQKSLSGAAVAVRVQRMDERLRIDVHDSGPGLAPGATDGVGLTNARARLAQRFGPAASLSLVGAPEGGTLARIECPFTKSPA